MEVRLYNPIRVPWGMSGLVRTVHLKAEENLSSSHPELTTPALSLQFCAAHSVCSRRSLKTYDSTSPNQELNLVAGCLVALWCTLDT